MIVLASSELNSATTRPMIQLHILEDVIYCSVLFCSTDLMTSVDSRWSRAEHYERFRQGRVKGGGKLPFWREMLIIYAYVDIMLSLNNRR
jgi:hypothetical protein